MNERAKQAEVKSSVVLQVAKYLAITPDHNGCKGIVTSDSVNLQARRVQIKGEEKETVVAVGRCGTCQQQLITYRMIGGSIEWELDTQSS